MFLRLHAVQAGINLVPPGVNHRHPPSRTLALLKGARTHLHRVGIRHGFQGSDPHQGQIVGQGQALGQSSTDSQTGIGARTPLARNSGQIPNLQLGLLKAFVHHHGQIFGLTLRLPLDTFGQYSTCGIHDRNRTSAAGMIQKKDRPRNRFHDLKTNLQFDQITFPTNPKVHGLALLHTGQSLHIALHISNRKITQTKQDIPALNAG